jgi:hypothetical protein
MGEVVYLSQEQADTYTAAQTERGVYCEYQNDIICHPHSKNTECTLGSIAEIFVNDMSPKSRYGDEEVPGLLGVRKFVLVHLQNLDKVRNWLACKNCTVFARTTAYRYLSSTATDHPT